MQPQNPIPENRAKVQAEKDQASQPRYIPRKESTVDSNDQSEESETSNDEGESIRTLQKEEFRPTPTIFFEIHPVEEEMVNLKDQEKQKIADQVKTFREWYLFQKTQFKGNQWIIDALTELEKLEVLKRTKLHDVKNSDGEFLSFGTLLKNYQNSKASLTKELKEA